MLYNIFFARFFHLYGFFYVLLQTVLNQYKHNELEG